MAFNMNITESVVLCFMKVKLIKIIHCLRIGMKFAYQLCVVTVTVVCFVIIPITFKFII